MSGSSSQPQIYAAIDYRFNIRSMFNGHERLRSFEECGIPGPRPLDLAEAGFFFHSLQNNIQCAFCSIIIGNWMPGDSPIDQHRRFSPSCLFLKGYNVSNVPIHGDPVRDRTQETIGDLLPVLVKSEVLPEGGLHVCLKYPEPPGHWLLHTQPVYNEYLPLPKRLDTFENSQWPDHLKCSIKPIAQAGLISIGEKDKVICFWCGIGLKGSDTKDDPWMEHAMLSNACGFIHMNLSRDYIGVCEKLARWEESYWFKQLLASGNDRRELLIYFKERLMERRNPCKCFDIIAKDFHRMKKKQKKPETFTLSSIQLAEIFVEPEENRKLCQICFNNEICIIFVPCGHLFSCDSCTKNYCLLCGTTIIHKQRLFLT